MSLNMGGHIDSVFKSVDIVVKGKTNGGWTPEGEPIPPVEINEPFRLVNIQPLNPRELQNQLMAGERIIDGRKLYINSGNLALLRLATDVEFLDQRWKIVGRDVREWRNYAKLEVSRYDG